MKAEFKAFVSKVLSNRSYKQAKKRFVGFLDHKDPLVKQSLTYFLVLNLEHFTTSPDFDIVSDNQLYGNTLVLQQAIIHPKNSKDKYIITDYFS